MDTPGPAYYEAPDDREDEDRAPVRGPGEPDWERDRMIDDGEDPHAPGYDEWLLGMADEIAVRRKQRLRARGIPANEGDDPEEGDDHAS